MLECKIVVFKKVIITNNKLFKVYPILFEKSLCLWILKSRTTTALVKNDKNDPPSLVHFVNTWCWLWWPVGVYAGGVCICVLSCGVLFTYGKNGCVIRQCTCRYMMSGFGCKEAVNILRSNVNVTKFMEIILLF